MVLAYGLSLEHGLIVRYRLVFRHVRTAGVHMKLYLAISQPPLSLYAPLVYMGGVLPYLMFLLHTAHIYQTSEHSWVYAAAGCMLLLVLPRALPTLTLNLTLAT